MATKEYSAKSIRVLDFPEAIRRRPGMYVGSTEYEGAFRCLREIIDNCIDEHLEGHGKLIRIVYYSDSHTFYVADAGRGIPVDIHPQTGQPAATTVFTRTHAGAKFDADSYKTSSGMNGVGAAATNALSEYFAYWTFRSNKWHHQSFSRGIADGPITKKAPPPGTHLSCGTVVAFKLDTQLFFDYLPSIDRIHDEVRGLSYLNPGLTLEVIMDGTTTTYTSTRGMLDFVSITDTDEGALGKPFSVSLDLPDPRGDAAGSPYADSRMHISASICWYDNDDIDVRSYCNSSYTRENGYHVNALKLALANAVKVDGKSEVDVRFLMYGMRAALQVKMQDPVYEGQTKNKLMSPEIVKPVRDCIEPALIEFFTRNKALVKALLERATKFQSNFSRMTEDNKAVKAIKLVARDARVDLPVKMKAAKPWVKPEDRELIIVEGDSAGSTAKPASFDWQEILPIRGKILNTGKASLAKVLGNQEVKDIITALGTSLGSKCDPSKGRVGKVCILTDADDDGYHIASLLAALFVTYFTPWVEQGRVYFINAPLYIGSYKELKFFGDTPEDVYSRFPNNVRSKVMLTRAKGWGEVSSVQLRTIAMDPRTRRMVRLTLDADDFLEMDRIMGEDPKHRKALLGIDTDTDESKEA